MALSYGTSPIIMTGYKAGDFLRPVGMAAVTTRTPDTAARVSAWPFSSPIATTIDRVGLNLITPQAGAKFMAGIYSSDNRGRPQSLLLDAGEVSLASGSGGVLATVAFQFIGLVWVLIWMKDVVTQASVSGLSTAAAGFMPSAAFNVTSGPHVLALAAAYPASMPVVAPAVVSAGSTVTDPVPQMRAA